MPAAAFPGGLFEVCANLSSPQGVRSVGRPLFENLRFARFQPPTRSVPRVTHFHPDGWPGGPMRLTTEYLFPRLQPKCAQRRFGDITGSFESAVLTQYNRGVPQFSLPRRSPSPPASRFVKSALSSPKFPILASVLPPCYPNSNKRRSFLNGYRHCTTTHS